MANNEVVKLSIRPTCISQASAQPFMLRCLTNYRVYQGKTSRVCDSNQVHPSSFVIAMNGPPWTLLHACEGHQIWARLQPVHAQELIMVAAVTAIMALTIMQYAAVLLLLHVTRTFVGFRALQVT